MVKTKTFRKRKISSSKRFVSRRKKRDNAFEISLRDDADITPFSAVEKLQDIKLIGTAVMQCLVANDPNGAMEAIESHLEAMNKSEFLKEAGIPRSTMYKLLKKKNPTIKTLAKILHAAHTHDKID